MATYVCIVVYIGLHSFMTDVCKFNAAARCTPNYKIQYSATHSMKIEEIRSHRVAQIKIHCMFECRCY